MYIYVRARCIGRGIAQQLVDVDISQTVVSDIYTKYRAIYLELSNIYLTGNVIVDFNILKEHYIGYSGTLTQLLTDLGNMSLATIPSMPVNAIKYATYGNAVQSGYKVDIGLVGTVNTNALPKASKKDLILTRANPVTDTSLIHSNALVSVNGYWHRTVMDGTRLMVIDGAKSLFKSNANAVGIWSFLNIGTVAKVGILPQNINSAPGGLLKDTAYLTIDQDVTNKTVLLCVGGYLIFPGQNTFWQVNNNTFGFSIQSTPYMERFIESLGYLDMSSLGLTIDPSMPTAIDQTQFLSDINLTRYLTLSQSFFVVINTPNIAVNKLFLKTAPTPGTFTTVQEPVYPLIVNYGKVAEYWKTQDSGAWVATCTDSFYRNFIFAYRPQNDTLFVTPSNLPAKSSFRSKGFLLEIGA